MRRQRAFWRAVITVCLVAIVALMAHGFIQGRQLSVRIGELTEQRAGLMADNANLESQLAYVQTDEFILRTARDQLGLIMPGEIRYVADYATAVDSAEP